MISWKSVKYKSWNVYLVNICFAPETISVRLYVHAALYHLWTTHGEFRMFFSFSNDLSYFLSYFEVDIILIFSNVFQ